MRTWTVFYSSRSNVYTYLYAFYDNNGDIVGFKEENAQSKKDMISTHIIFQSKSYKCTSMEKAVVSKTKKALEDLGKFKKVASDFVKIAA